MYMQYFDRSIHTCVGWNIEKDTHTIVDSCMFWSKKVQSKFQSHLYVNLPFCFHQFSVLHCTRFFRLLCWILDIMKQQCNGVCSRFVIFLMTQDVLPKTRMCWDYNIHRCDNLGLFKCHVHFHSYSHLLSCPTLRSFVLSWQNIE